LGVNQSKKNLLKEKHMNLKSFYTLVLLSLFLGNLVFAQEQSSPYKTSLKTDAPIVAGLVGLNVLGLSIIKNKNELTLAQLNALNKEDVFFMDRGTAGNFSDKADKDSYIPFYASFAAAPIMAFLNKNQRSHTGQVMVLFVETMAVTGAAFTLTAGLVDRSRPLVYNTSLPVEDRIDKDAQRSFFAGHTAATAAASFFVAKVFQDFNPDSRAKPYVWAAAAAVPATVGYLRLKAGKHFLSDNLLGYAIGAGAGILVPQLHKKNNKTNVSLTPAMGFNYQGLSLKYQFKH
jgi:membrane-associated phospholipid phosphatase